jgi:hypothetical protein
MQATIQRFLKYSFFIFVISTLVGQEKDIMINSAFRCVQERINNEIERGSIEQDPLIIVNGYLIHEQKQIEILKKFECSEIEEISILSSNKSKQQFDGEKARNGIVLLTLKKKAGKIWKRSYKSLNKPAYNNGYDQ